MGLLANLLSFLSIATGTASVQTSCLIFTEEPVCPKEFL